MDRGAWRATVHGVAKCPARLSTHTLNTLKWFRRCGMLGHAPCAERSADQRVLSCCCWLSCGFVVLVLREQGLFSQGTLSKRLELLLLAVARCGACLPPVAEARDAAQHPTTYRTVPTAQDDLAPNARGARVEKLEEEGVPGGTK